jgi:hypothetical protein
MKWLFSLPCMVFCHSIIAQQADIRLTVHDQSSQRLSVMKSALSLRQSDEVAFLPIYAQYEGQLVADDGCSLASVNQLASSSRASEAAACVRAVLKSQNQSVVLRREYFEKINSATNGTVAFQFLQFEALLDLLQQSRLYENTNWNHPQWHKAMLKDEAIKREVMEFTLGLNAEQREKFRPLYEDYEFEYSRVVGHQLVWFEQFIEDVSDFTPAQCKKLGREFLSMQQNELKIRERFLKKFIDILGEETAARYMALEDYFSMMAKLKTWSENDFAVR